MSAPEQGTAEAKGSRRSSTTLILALIAVGVIVLGAITVALLHHSDTSGDRTGAVTPTPGPAPATTGEGQTGFAVPDVDAFGRRVDIPNNPAGQPLAQTSGPHAATDPAWLTAAPILPEQGGWQRVFGVSVPFSTSDGPTNMIDGVPVGYSHTPQGAALAAVFTTWEAYARPGDWTLRERMEVMTDADHAEFDRLQAAGKVPAQAPVAATRWLVAPDAFQIESFSATGDLCVLKIATKAPPASAGGPAQWQASQLTMVWDGQWRLRLAPGGHLPGSTIGSLDGWTRW
ncbi:hypothetical protein [Nocardia sp. NBC_00511]|uniref:hypothetical protein n=1 Tax=Nocardia sp. NBC_00511 TaxID=2903591 RepID=UPI002F91AF60